MEKHFDPRAPNRGRATSAQTGEGVPQGGACSPLTPERTRALEKYPDSASPNRGRAISAHTGGSALNAAPVTIGFSRGTVGTKTAQPFSARENKKAPKTQKVFGTGINFILRCHPNWLAAHSFPRHHAAGAVTGAIPGVSFAPLLSPFPKTSAAALTAYTPLSGDIVS